MKLNLSIFAASLLSMVAANAATITWTASPYTTNGSVGQNLDTDIFATTGTQILAENSGGNALTFDGINFAAGTTSFGASAAVFHDASGNTLLAREGTYGDSGASTVSLSGLISGQAYRIQALVFDGRGTAGIPGRTVSFDGIDQGVYANGVSGVTWGDGLLVTGTFTADATTQDFTIEAFAGATSKGGQLNALLVHAVPEPSSAALLGLGGLALVLRRRK